MSVITSSPFNLVQDALIKVSVFAINSIGSGLPSSYNTIGVRAQTPPHKPPTAPTRNAATSQATVHVDYALLTTPATGGSTILSLQLQWDAGTSGATWTTLIGFSPYSTTQTMSISGAQIITGRVYKFRYRAFNIHGWGAYSDAADILAASSPSPMNAVVTTLVGV